MSPNDNSPQRNVLLIADNEFIARRLSEILGNEGQLLISEASALERILQVVDSANILMVVVHVISDTTYQRLTLIEELHEAKPLLPILVFAEEDEPNFLLNAMRAGANDLVTLDTPKRETLERLQVLMKKGAQYAPTRDRPNGKLLAVVSARPDADSAMLSLHLGLALVKFAPQGKVLLLDLGIPEADSLSFLDLQVSYTFDDAIRSIRRFDETLIETAFAKHPSGLMLLAMAEDSEVGRISAADIIVLLNILCTHFQHVVVNLSGLPKSEFLQLITSRADQAFLLCEQTVPSCRSNKKLRDFLEHYHSADNLELIVDRYLASQQPNADEIAERLHLPLRTTLPPSGMARLFMKNSGQSLFEFAPNDKYTLSVEQLAKSLLGITAIRSRNTLAKVTRWFRS